MVISVAVGLLVGVLVVFGAYFVLERRVKRLRRVALHMKPGHGPTVEGLLAARTRREFHLVKAELLTGPDDTTELAGPVRVLRENVFGYEVLE